MNKVVTFLLSFYHCLFLKTLFVKPDSICTYERLPDNYELMNASISYVARWGPLYTGFEICHAAPLTPYMTIVSINCVARRSCVRNPSSMKFQYCSTDNPTVFDIVEGKSTAINSNKKLINNVVEIIYHPKYFDGKYKINPTYGVAVLKGKRRISYPDTGYYNVKIDHKFYFDDENFSYCTLLYYGNSPCTKTFTQDLRKNKYVLQDGKSFIHLKKLDIYPINLKERKRLCDEQYERYVKAGIIYDKTMIFCAMVFGYKKDCDDVTGAGLYCGGRLAATVIAPPLNCHFEEYPIFFLRTTDIGDWIEYLTEYNEYDEYRPSHIF